MKKLFYLLLVISIAACQNEGGEKAPAKGADWSGYQMQDLGSGMKMASKKNAKGELLEEGSVSNGSKDGNWVTYHTKNGIPATITGYSNGVKNGSFVKINDRGNFEEIASFSNGELNGLRKIFDRTRVIEESNYKGGKLDGSRKLFYKGGEVKEEGIFKNGQRDGVAKWYDEEGNVTIEMKYDNGKKIE